MAASILQRFRSLTESAESEGWVTPPWPRPFYRARAAYAVRPLAERRTLLLLRTLVTEAEDKAEDEWLAAFDKAVGAINPLTRKRDDYWAKARDLHKKGMSPEAAAKDLTAEPDKPAKKPAPAAGGGAPPDKDDDEGGDGGGAAPAPSAAEPKKTQGGVPVPDDEDEDEDEDT